MTKIYFDHNATTNIEPQALQAMVKMFELPINDSSIHHFGQIGKKVVLDAKKALDDLLNASAFKVIFTSCGSEANNQAIFGFDDFKIATSFNEHDSVLQAAKMCDHVIIKTTKDGLLDLDDLQQNLAEIKGNFLVSLTFANNETGILQDVKKAAQITHKYGGIFHCDLTQGVGKCEIDLEKLNIDLATISGHKFGAPMGVGALLIRQNIDLKPLIYGGGQQQNLRSGTLNIPAIAGFEKACIKAQENLNKAKKIQELRDLLEKSLIEICQENIVIFGQNQKRLPNTSYFGVKGLDSQMMVIKFDLNSILLSSGSACSSGTSKESKILKVMDIDPDFIKGAMRISLSKNNTKKELEEFLAIFKEIYLQK